jgi:hypothetical protein
MVIPIGPIVEAITTLANAVGLWITKQKADRTEEKRKDLGKEVSDMQVAFEKQTVFIDSLIQQVRALALQVQKQEAVITQLRILTFLSLGISVLLFATVLWMETYH